MRTPLTIHPVSNKCRSQRGPTFLHGATVLHGAIVRSDNAKFARGDMVEAEQCLLAGNVLGPHHELDALLASSAPSIHATAVAVAAAVHHLPPMLHHAHPPRPEVPHFLLTLVVEITAHPKRPARPSRRIRVGTALNLGHRRHLLVRGRGNGE